MTTSTPVQQSTLVARTTSFWVLFAISSAHLLNDLKQAILPAVYPLLRDLYMLDFTQIGLITLVNQITASFFQPFIGSYTDKHPQPYSLAIGMCFTLVGVLVLAFASSFIAILIAAALMGIGSAVFHPEASRVARMASGGRLGFAQSLFQVGGNIGTAIGPLAAAFIILPRGQNAASWFALVAVVCIILLWSVGNWYAAQNKGKSIKAQTPSAPLLPRNQLIAVFSVLLLLILSKNVYNSSMISFYTFFVIDKFGMSASSAQVLLFIYLGAVAAGTFLGGPIGDKIGRKKVIWFSILGPLPFALAMPHASLEISVVLTILVGFILASAFSAIVVYAQELLPGRVGMVSGMMFGFSFGIGAVGAAVLGVIADQTSIQFIFVLCSFLPLMGLLAAFLPETNKLRS